MAAPHRNYELKKSQPSGELIFILLNNSKFIKRRSFFHFKYLSSPHFAIPCTPLPGAAATLAPPAPSYAPGCKNCEYHFCAIKQRTSRGRKVENEMISQRCHLATLAINSVMVSKSHATLTTVSKRPMKCIAPTGV
jgi:hypothetical protein